MGTQRELVGNHKQTSKLLGFSEQALHKAVNERNCPLHRKGGKGRGNGNLYFWPDVIAWRISDLTGSVLDLEAERARLAKEQADKIARENAKGRGETLTAVAVVDAWSEQIANARKKLLTMPTKLAPRFTNISDPNVIAKAMRAEIYAALSELSEYELDEPKSAHGTDNAPSGEGVGTAAGTDGK